MKNSLKKSDKKDLQTIADAIEEAEVCMITTVDHNGGLCSRPMNVQELDEEGNLWFFTLSDSNLMEEIRRIPVVNITFTCGKNKFLSATAIGYEAFDKEKMTDLWGPSLNKWFKEGLDTEGLTLLKLDLQEVEYWGPPHSSIDKVMDFVNSIAGVEPDRPFTYEKVDLRQQASGD